MSLFRHSTPKGVVSSLGGRKPGRRASSRHDVDPNAPLFSPTGQEGGVVLTVIVAVAVTLSRHAGAMLSGGAPQASHVLGVLLDTMLTVPVVGAAVWLASRTASLLGMTAQRRTASVSMAALLSLYFVPLFAPLAAVLTPLHQMVGVAGGEAHAAHQLTGLDVAGLANHGLLNAAAAQPVVLVAGLAMLMIVAGLADGRFTLPQRAGRRGRARVATAIVMVPALVAGMFLVPLTAPSASAEEDVGPAAHVGGCGGSGVQTRTYNVLAINIDITINRFGDHDPFGFMFVQAEKLNEVRAQEAALKANAAPGSDGSGAKVSNGLGQDAIQPLILRARLGECVQINLTNRLTAAPRGGPGFTDIPVVTQAGGVPSVSIDMAGVSFDAAQGAGGQAVGNNPTNVMVPPGATYTYRYFLDPLMGEGVRVFRSGGDSTQLTLHGLFGALVAEPAGSTWLDPDTGADRTNDRTFNSFAAIIRPGSGTSFREFTLLYHEIGDEMFNLRRPPRETGTPISCVPATDGLGVGDPFGMRDEGLIANCGYSTSAYRPGSRALNYRSESFYRRLETQAQRGFQTDDTLNAAESLTYGSYANGDPATPMPRSYLGEPTKMRLAHAGGETLHVHHLHGGGDRWPMNPNAVANNFAGGLQKNPPNNASSVMLDSQTLGPAESYDARIECGAGGCQQAAGDFLWHCHIAHHYIAGMWAFWRVFDTRQSNLAVIPGRTTPPDAVTSQFLLGKTIEGKTVVPRAGLNDPNTQVAVEDLVERQLPPQGVRLNNEDATVWDWQLAGTPAAPLYNGEPESTDVWPNFQSPTPGQRNPILFNPNNGRPAWPLLRPHLGLRPPFAGAGHSGAAWLGETGSSTRPDGLCPQNSPVRTYNVTGVSVPIQETLRERDANGTVFVLNEDKDRVLADAASGVKAPDPLAIRSNVGDCVAITLTNEMNPLQQPKVNMHTHFVQFDPQSSDGVITGLSFEQSVYPNALESRTVTAASPANATQVTVTNVTNLRPGIFIAVGSGEANIEIRRITAISGTTLTFDRALTSAHAVGESVSVEFVQYRWYSDVDSGTVFWHDHVNGIESWAHGMFGAHIIEPRGSTYHDPRTGAEVRSGTIVDIRTTNLVGGGVRSSFREFMVFLSNGRRGRAELTADPAVVGRIDRNAGQECEESSINLRAAPIGERTPPGANTQQRQEFNGELVCRNATSRVNDPTAANTVVATVTAVDPYAFSSVKYGDPTTPLFRAYAGDPVVIRTIGVTDRVEALRFQGHRFARERFNADGELVDAATTGISERFDYVLDGGAGGPQRMAGDYLYYSTRNFAFESGGWGIFRVHDRLQSDLRPLPGRTAPPTGAGFPILQQATGNTQTTPGPNPPPSTQSGVVSSTASPCAANAPVRGYDVSVFNQTLPTAPQADTNGVMYSLTSDMAAIRAGTKRPEPLVLRVNQGDCLQVTLRNQIAAGTQYGGTRAGFDLGKLLYNPQISAGSAVGLNPDTTVAAGQTFTYRFAADKLLGTSVFQNLGSPASMRHGAYGQVIVEPTGSTWFHSVDGGALGATRTSTEAIIRHSSGNFREFALSMGSNDQKFSRSINEYQDVIAGSGVNSQFPLFNRPVANAPVFSSVNYSSAPLTTRLGLTTSPPNADPAWEVAFSSARFGDPATPVFRAVAGDPVVIRLSIGASDQFHVFSVGGHVFPQEPNMWNGGSDRRSQLLPSRSFTAGETTEVELVGGAGGTTRATGDYLYGDMRQPFTGAGMWGIFRVLPAGSPGLAAI
jgi:FtsP/CotA-like multicopper oxidase with cupredoxin domain